MKMSFWERLLRALELYCLIKKQEMGQINTANASLIADEVDIDTGELIDALEVEASEFYVTKHMLNAKEFPKRYEVPYGVSMTIPDQTMSINEILTRFASGLPIDGERVPIYEGEEDDMPDLEHMDLAEREEYVESAKRELAEIDERLTQEKRKKAVKPKEEPKDDKPNDDKPKEQAKEDDKKLYGIDDNPKEFFKGE